MSKAGLLRGARWLVTLFVAVSVAYMCKNVLWGGGTLIFSARTATAGFVVLGVLCGGLCSTFGFAVFIGLMFCAAGDVLGPMNFYAGVAAFFFGHVAFIVAAAINGVKAPRLLAAAPFLVLSTCAILYWILPRVPPSDRFTVLAYVAVITTMVAMAEGTSGNARGRLFLFAGIAFYISDIFVARWKYVSNDWLNPLLCYPIYYTACVAFAWTIAVRTKKVFAQDPD